MLSKLVAGNPDAGDTSWWPWNIPDDTGGAAEVDRCWISLAAQLSHGYVKSFIGAICVFETQVLYAEGTTERKLFNICD